MLLLVQLILNLHRSIIIEPSLIYQQLLLISKILEHFLSWVLTFRHFKYYWFSFWFFLIILDRSCWSWIHATEFFCHFNQGHFICYLLNSFVNLIFIVNCSNIVFKKLSHSIISPLSTLSGSSSTQHCSFKLIAIWVR